MSPTSDSHNSNINDRCDRLIASMTKKRQGYVKYIPPANSQEKKYMIYKGWATKRGNHAPDETYLAFTPNIHFKKYIQSLGMKWKVSKMGWLIPKHRLEETVKAIETDCKCWERVAHFDTAKAQFHKHPILQHAEQFLE